MKSENARYFLKWCNRYPWIVDCRQKIGLDIDHKICLTNPGVWTYMFKSQIDRDKFKRIISEAS
jgi:hypothetical protein